MTIATLIRRWAPDRFAPRGEIGGPARYKWDEVARKFRNRKGGIIARKHIRAALDEYVDRLDAEVKSLTESLVEGQVSIGDWQIAMERILKRGHTSATAIAKGGWKQAKAADWATAGRMLRSEYGYLNRFAREIERGELSDGKIIQRARMYAIAPTKTYESILRRDDIKAGFDLERRILHSKYPCGPCHRYAAMKWQKAGVLPNIGEKCDCKSNCRCTFERRRTKKPPIVPPIKPPKPPRVKPPKPVPVAPPPPPPEPVEIDPYARIRAARERQRDENEAWKPDPKTSWLLGDRYQKLRRRFPDLIPPGEIQDRIAKYRIGDAKVESVLQVGKKYGALRTRLDGEREDYNKEMLRLMDEQHDLISPYVQASKNFPPEVIGKVTAIQSKIDAIVSKRDAVKARLDVIKTQQNYAAHGVLMTDDKATLYANPADAALKTRRDLDPLGLENTARTRKALDWLANMTSRGDDSTVDIMVGQKAGQRAYHAYDKTHIAIGDPERIETIIHEYGHAIAGQFRTGGDPTWKRDEEFLSYRVGSERLTQLKTLNGGFDEDEVGRKDKFDRVFDESPWDAYYVGKYYSAPGSTEILSMGVQKLYEDPVKFAERDPEYFKYVCGVLDGSLR